MAFSHSPRKVVPLARGDDKPPSLRTRSTPSVTKRVFFCGVVVENTEYGQVIPQDVQELVASLGDPLGMDAETGGIPYGSDSITGISEVANGLHTRKRAMTDTSALSDVINELVATERSYVKRLRILKLDYADPLRNFSRSKSTAIIPSYEAKTLFGNIDQLLPVNEAFLEDLERMMAPDGPQTVGGVGDVALKHFRDLRGFENYKGYYSKREEAQGIFEKEMKKASGFAAYIDRIKYSSADIKNRIGLRELLMDPVQRIPRYTLMFRIMIKYMAPHDTQRAKLVEADEIASKIALAETDEQTKRATIMYCLGATIEDFPADLVSHSRQFIDCIDVEDVLEGISAPGPVNNGRGAVPANLHCTLFLFDDKLIIVKRPGNGEKSGRNLSGLNDLDKLTKSGGLPLGLKKSGMSFKGIVDVTDVVATDVGGPDIHIYLETPPQDQTERWSGRPFRALSVVNPPSPINLDPTRTEADKKRFLDNLWSAQAHYRTKAGQSVVLCAEEREVESRGGKATRATTYFNIYQRTAFLKEPKKTKVVLHIDPSGIADPIPFGMRSAPHVVVRVQPMAGELSRYTVSSNYANDEGEEEDIVQTARVSDRIVHTIHQFGLFSFKTGNVSIPSTPTASLRSKAAMFGLDAISRNLFNAFPGGSSKGDIFGGSINSHRRSKTTGGRSLQSNSTVDGSFSHSSRSRSNSTATVTTMTSVSLMDDGQSMNIGSVRTRSRSLSTAKKLIKRGKSPGSGSEPDTSPIRSSSRLSHSISAPERSRSPSRERRTDYSDDEEDPPMRGTDESERDLAARLELARRNSQNQHEAHFIPVPLEQPMEDTIYEEEPPQPVTRPASRASRASRDLPEIPPDSQSQRSTTPRPERTSIFPESDSESPRRSRSLSRHSHERRPYGPRTPSPLPPTTPLLPAAPELPAMDVDLALEDTLVNMSQPPVTPRRNDNAISPLPRSKRQPFEPTGNTDVTPRAAAAGADDTLKSPGSVEPLSIKKKTSVRANGSPTQGRRTYSIPRSSPLLKPNTRLSSPRKTLSQTKNISRIPAMTNRTLNSGSTYNDNDEELLTLSEATKEDLESACRAVKRIKLEVEQLRSAGPSSPATDIERPASPMKGLRTIQRTVPPPMTKEALARMEEMQRLIGKRVGETTPRARPLSMMTEGSLSRLSASPRMDDAARNIEELASQSEQDLAKAIKSQDLVHAELKTITTRLKERSAELEKSRIELQGARRQTEVMKSLLGDCTAEKEIMYEAFNDELDGMYEDCHLPEDEAWTAMTKDLRQAKDARNTLSKENSNLKRRLADVELQNEEWGALLRAHGLIP